MEVQKKQCGSGQDDWMRRHIGYEVRTLDHMIGRLVNAYQSSMQQKACQAYNAEQNYRELMTIYREIMRNENS